MNLFYRAIGFSNIKNKKDTDLLISKVLANPTEKFVKKMDADTTFVQVNKDFGENIGVSVVGELDSEGYFNADFCFPYTRGNKVLHQEEIQIDRHMDREAYAGITENVNIGVTLIFYMQNIADYIERNASHEAYEWPDKVMFSGLAREATILLEINKDEKEIEKEKTRNDIRNNLLEAARAGDVDAIENLTLDDMDTYTIISRRAKKEDVLTIVDSYFMPYGIESDQYSVLGEILETKKVHNTETNECLHIMTVDCNALTIQVCVNDDNLVGEPVVGRRFKANIWLQGNIVFSDKDKKRG